MATNISKQGVASASGNVNPNLAKNSLVNIAPTTVYNISNFNLTEEVISGTKYTCTLKGVIGANKQFGLWMGGGYTQLGFFTENNGIFTLTFTGPSSIAGNGSRTAINLYAYPSSTANASSLEWLKLEKGVVSTAWLPSTTDAISVGVTCGFTELNGSKASIAKEYMSAKQFYEI